MRNLILQTSPMAQWHALVEEACTSSSIALTEELASYLVFLLMRFTNNPECLSSIVAIDYLNHLKKNRSENLQLLRETGDKCLLFAGLFPHIAKKRRLQVSYYVELGQSAYASLSESYKNQLSILYGNLYHHFVLLMDVLHSIRELDPNTEFLELLAAEELWQKTHSTSALRILRKATKGFLMMGSPTSLHQKH